MEEESRPWFTDGSVHYPGTIQKWTAVALYSLSETTLKETPTKKNLDSEQNFGHYTCSLHFVLKEKWPENVGLFADSLAVANRLPG